MTCIVGIVDTKSNRVIIGGDSAGLAGDTVFIRKDVKVFRNGNFIIGCTSSFRMIQLLRFSFTPPLVGSKDIFQYMCTDFINAIKTCLLDGGYSNNIEEGLEIGGTFLVGHKDRLFKIDSDFQVAETVNGIDACGCGQDYALGAMHAMISQPMTPEEMLLKALEATEFYCVGVRGPFTFSRTK